MGKIKQFFRLYREILIRLLFTVALLLFFRFGALITMPGVTLRNLDNVSNNNFLNLLSILGGGVLNRVSVFALGISPFITASIIVQLLTTGLIPGLKRWQNQGQKGARKLNLLTKLIMLPIAYMQGLGTIKTLENSNVIQVNWNLVDSYQVPLFYYFLCPLMLIAGSMITLLIAHLINQKGIGHGTSIIIFTGILVTLPQNFETAAQSLFQPDLTNDLLLINLVRFILYLLVLFGLIYFVVALNNSERRIPIQQTGAGLVLNHQKISYLPIKVNPAGVIPVIFSSTLISIFQSVSVLLNQPDSQYTQFVNNYLDFKTWTGIAIFAVLTFFFVLLYSRIIFNTQTMAENFAKNGTYLIGIRPGLATERYLNRILNRISIFGAFYLSFLAIFAMVFAKLVFPDLTQVNFVIGGTSILILTMIGQAIIEQLKNFRTQLYYVNLRQQKGDYFQW